MLLQGVVAAAMVSMVGLVASAWVRSPAELAAEAKPPTPTVLTAAVVFKKLTRNTIFRGTFAASGTVSFTPKTALAPDGAAGSNTSGVSVVTAVKVKVGQQVKAGKVLAEVAYRPVFALPGKIPAIRDLAEGDVGRDVAELQRGLATLGYGRGSDRLGIFGSGTAFAVRRFYAAIGYPVPTQASGTRPADANGGSNNDAKAPSKARIGNEKSSGTKKVVMMPASEVMYVPSPQVTVTRMAGRVGDKAGSPLITLSTNGLRLQGHLDPGMKGAVKVGQAVEVLDEASGKARKGKIDKIGQLVTPRTGQDGSTATHGGDKGNQSGDGQSPQADGGTPYIPVDISPTSGNWAVNLADQDVRITAYADVSDGKVLAVPEGAITTTANGAASVMVVGPGGLHHRVAVTPGGSADGLVAVNPATSQDLREGDQVVVGR
ncbi:peptidoglycan-binding domain-containing protein [Actinoallomurus iriomotensis]|uniref:Peptidoglycan binding-like domain-containing protein n=1 Tax=Actinoallomurus iriomotensis TaxID=478107 RepID=A0A9W6RSS2_9ACTN|nr:peptidoglycan-binding domain-containing protein [Actinoallomurus iriomotensis]GLY79255.1 hypothetical protein Airi01_075220 [Actinoallomurus iriomotensis]